MNRHGTSVGTNANLPSNILHVILDFLKAFRQHPKSSIVPKMINIDISSLAGRWLIGAHHQSLAVIGNIHRLPKAIKVSISKQILSHLGIVALLAIPCKDSDHTAIFFFERINPNGDNGSISRKTNGERVFVRLFGKVIQITHVTRIATRNGIWKGSTNLKERGIQDSRRGIHIIVIIVRRDSHIHTWSVIPFYLVGNIIRSGAAATAISTTTASNMIERNVIESHDRISSDSSNGSITRQGHVRSWNTNFLLAAICSSTKYFPFAMIILGKNRQGSDTIVLPNRIVVQIVFAFDNGRHGAIIGHRHLNVHRDIRDSLVVNFGRNVI
mmetsp:Transcript_18000/g.29822  ORF Transcript_18000/g.29822 Transcript_18000/m.29822 type:complete len:327 (-) Transcript_18000:1044-2024(-)